MRQVLQKTWDKTTQTRVLALRKHKDYEQDLKKP